MELGVPTPKFALQAAIAAALELPPGLPHPIGLLSTKIPSAGLPPE